MLVERDTSRDGVSCSIISLVDLGTNLKDGGDFGIYRDILIANTIDQSQHAGEPFK